LALLVLRLLNESTLSEWEILSSLHGRYGLNPNAREFGRLEKELLAQGYASVQVNDTGNTMRITASGRDVLQKLEREHREVVSKAMQLQPNSSGAVPR
jgi:CTP-dependent riboflavin kinase